MGRALRRRGGETAGRKAPSAVLLAGCPPAGAPKRGKCFMKADYTKRLGKAHDKKLEAACSMCQATLISMAGKNADTDEVGGGNVMVKQAKERLTRTDKRSVWRAVG